MTTQLAPLSIDPALVQRYALATDHPETLPAFDDLALGGVVASVIVEDHRMRGTLDLLASIVADAIKAQTP